MSEIHNLLGKIGFSEKQSQVFLVLYQYGPKPASSVAKMIGWERTNIYKLIQVLVRQGLIAETTKQWVKHFYVPNKNVLRDRIAQHKKEIEQQEEILPLIENELHKLDEQRISPIPKMRFFEGKSGMENLFDDMRGLIQENHYVMIKCIASNTLESQSTSLHQLSDYAGDFFTKLQKNNIHVESYLGNGILTLEQIMKTHDINILPQLPAGNATVNIFIVWDTLYLIIFKQIPFWLKIQSEAFADMMHFLLKQI